MLNKKIMKKKIMKKAYNYMAWFRKHRNTL